MRLGKLLLGGGAAVGAAAAANALVARDVVPLFNEIGGEEGAFTWRGHRVAYTRRGEGPNVLLVHSIHATAWSLEWRHNVDALAEGHTVWTIDLLGFGRSDRPAVDYTAALFCDLVADFAAEVIGGPTALVGASLAGAYVVALGARYPERFPALVVIGPTGVTRLERPNAGGGVTGAVQATFASPVIGTALFNALVSRPSIEFFLKRTYADDRLVTPALVDAYHRSAHQPGARYAPAAFVGMRLNLDVRDDLARLTVPLLVTWGKQALQVPITELPPFVERCPGAEAATFADAGDLPHDEVPDAWNPRVAAFLGRTAAAAKAA
jgi:pimeloyl-ACP methyl ester carboxylesterase